MNEFPPPGAPSSAPASPRLVSRLRLASVLCGVALGGLVTPRSAQTTCEYALEYGMNPSFQTWSSRGIVFADAMTRVKDFELFTGNESEMAPTIPVGQGLLGEGWPDPAMLDDGQEFGALIFGSMEGTIPDGRGLPYVLTWEGTGTCRLDGLFVMGEQNRTPNRVEVTVDPTIVNANTGLSCHWTSPDPDDPVRNIRCWLPGMETSGNIFWPPYLEKVRQMNGGRGPSSWRTLDWTRVNDYNQIGPEYFVFDLDHRITPASARQGTPRGIATEYQVAFCNELGINLHLQVPHRGPEISEWEYLLYLYETFLTIRDGSPAVPGLNGDRPFEGLRPDLEVTIELSNEIWNPGFAVHGWMSSEALLNGRTSHEQIASQIELVFDIADGIFGPDPRLKKFIGGSRNNPNFLGSILDALRPGFHVDAVGPAAYIGPRQADIDAWNKDWNPTTGTCPNCPSLSEILATTRNSVELIRPGIAAHRAIADAYVNPDGSNPRLVLYEAGQSMKSLFQPWSKTANSAQTSPEMYAAYADDLVPMLVEEGVEEVIWYSFMTDQTPDLFAPYGVWNDMNQIVSVPTADTYVDDGVPKVAAIYLGPPLRDDCPKALTFHRTHGGNLDTLTGTLPVLGRTFKATVDLDPGQHPLALLFSLTSPALVPLAGNQALLTSGPLLFAVPMVGDPLASASLVIPADPALAGMVVTVQAAHFGGTAPLELSNALDLVLGR